MLRRFRMQRGTSSSSSCPEKQRRRRWELQSWGGRGGYRWTSTTCSWPESSRHSEHCTQQHIFTIQAVVSRCILGYGGRFWSQLLIVCLFVSLSPSVRSTWTRSYTPMNPLRNTFINSTPAPADHHTPSSGLSSCDSVLIKSIDCYSHTQCELNLK